MPAGAFSDLKNSISEQEHARRGFLVPQKAPGLGSDSLGSEAPGWTFVAGRLFMLPTLDLGGMLRNSITALQPKESLANT